MERCPICRAQLGSEDVCRRCHADLGNVRRIVQTSERLAGAALRALAENDGETALRLLRSATALRAEPDIAWLVAKVATKATPTRGTSMLPQGQTADAASQPRS